MKPNPHDALVRYTFGDLAHARGLLQSLVPPALAQIIEWGSLSLEDGSFIDPQLRERQTDLLYRTHLREGREVFLYLLLEHQSSSDRWMPHRIWGYIDRIWARYRRREPTAGLLPVVVPLILHHSARGWSAPTSLDELLDADDQLKQALGPLLSCSFV